MIHDVKLPLRTLLFVFCYALFNAFFLLCFGYSLSLDRVQCIDGGRWATLGLMRASQKNGQRKLFGDGPKQRRKEKWVFLALKRIPKIFRSWLVLVLTSAGCWLVLVLAGVGWRRHCRLGEVVIVLKPGAEGEASWKKREVLGLGLSWGIRLNPILALVLGLSWSPSPGLLMEGPIAPYASHSHGPSPWWVSPFSYFIS